MRELLLHLERLAHQLPERARTDGRRFPAAILLRTAVGGGGGGGARGGERPHRDGRRGGGGGDTSLLRLRQRRPRISRRLAGVERIRVGGEEGERDGGGAADRGVSDSQRLRSARACEGEVSSDERARVRHPEEAEEGEQRRLLLGDVRRRRADLQQ